METRDSSGSTPLELAKQFASLVPDDIERERQSVRRWDVVAGGTGADWDACLRLLEGAAAASSEGEGLAPTTEEEKATKQRPVLASAQLLDSIAKSYCEEDDGECLVGRCRTAAWEGAFRMALASSMEKSLDSVAKSMRNIGIAADDGVDGRCLPCPMPPSQTNMPSSPDACSKTINASDSTTPARKTAAPAAKMMGRRCDSCGKHSAALFRSVNHMLVCRQCRRKGRRV